MNIKQAIKEVDKGKKITHKSFNSGQFIELDSDGFLVDEKGIYKTGHFWGLHNSDEFNEGWKEFLDEN